MQQPLQVNKTMNKFIMEREVKGKDCYYNELNSILLLDLKSTHVKVKIIGFFFLAAFCLFAIFVFVFLNWTFHSPLNK